ncbi:hypothetical protein [Kitasatospora sp. GP82]|uniref:hypothetical protein n=1 Tax=Kitasatospora sp. GP82 TaxID=3035089 RepID=UPI00247682FF|nr:hypothetical protein [Kitasatospora sp. GP82]MDH6128566.1 hypothetical protein [Kitasatospora sp. GP82]
MPETVQNVDASRLRPAVSATVADGVGELDRLDEQLIAQLVLRVHCARDQQLSRRAAGLPATTLAEETAMMRQYATRLGQPGVGIALAILALSRSAAHATGSAEVPL